MTNLDSGTDTCSQRLPYWMAQLENHHSTVYGWHHNRHMRLKDAYSLEGKL